jgi:rod shape-determining protein MreB
VVACGRIIAKRTHPIGGDSFDAAIVEYVRKRHNVEISLKAAEAVKKQVGTVWVGNEKRSAEAYGRDLSNGDYCTVRITSEEMFTALEEPMAALIEVVCAAITKIPPDHVREVFDTGILLTGGGCLLEGLDKMISGVTGVNATCLREPTTAVVSGLARLLEWTQGNRGRIGTRNISKYIMKPATESQRGKKV